MEREEEEKEPTGCAASSAMMCRHRGFYSETRRGAARVHQEGLTGRDEQNTERKRRKGVGERERERAWSLVGVRIWGCAPCVDEEK